MHDFGEWDRESVFGSWIRGSNEQKTQIWFDTGGFDLDSQQKNELSKTGVCVCPCRIHYIAVLISWFDLP